jgi:hypothetical protein
MKVDRQDDAEREQARAHEAAPALCAAVAVACSLY